MRRLASVAAPSKPRAAAGRSDGSTLSAAGQSAQPHNVTEMTAAKKKLSDQRGPCSVSGNQIYPEPFSRLSVSRRL